MFPKKSLIPNDMSFQNIQEIKTGSWLERKSREKLTITCLPANKCNIQKYDIIAIMTLQYLHFV